MNADLEAAIAEGRRRMKQFEEKTSHQIDMFDREVDNHHHILGHKYSRFTEDFKPVSWPLWGVVLETSSGQRVYKEHVPFDLVAKCPRHCSCTSHIFGEYDQSIESSSYLPPLETDSYIPPIEPGGHIPSVESQAIMQGHKWGVNKYLYDEEYVSNPPYGIIMRKPASKRQSGDLSATSSRSSSRPFSSEISEERQPNTKLVSQYWRRKWKIPKDW